MSESGIDSAATRWARSLRDEEIDAALSLPVRGMEALGANTRRGVNALGRGTRHVLDRSIEGLEGLGAGVRRAGEALGPTLPGALAQAAAARAQNRLDLTEDMPRAPGSSQAGHLLNRMLAPQLPPGPPLRQEPPQPPVSPAMVAALQQSGMPQMPQVPGGGPTPPGAPPAPPPGPQVANGSPGGPAVQGPMPTAMQGAPTQAPPMPQQGAAGAPGSSGGGRTSIAMSTSQRGPGPSGVAPMQMPGGVGPAAAATPGDPWEAQLKRIQAQREALDKQHEALYAPPDYSQLQEQMRQRASQALPSTMASILMGRGPEASRHLADDFARRANEYRQPMKVEGGHVTAEGEVMIDPAYKRQQQMNLLQQRINTIDKLEQSAVNSQEKAQLQRERIAAEMEMKRFMMESQHQTRAMIAAVAAAGREGRGGKIHPMSDFIDKTSGNMVVRDEAGGFYSQRPVMGQDGKPTGQTMLVQIPYSDVTRAVVPTSDDRKDLAKIADNLQGVRVALAIGDTMTPADARGHGPLGGAIRSLGQTPSAIMENYVMTDRGRSFDQKTEAVVGQIRNTRFGQTLTFLENVTGNRLLPSMHDKPGIKMQKLRGLYGMLQNEEAGRKLYLQPGVTSGLTEEQKETARQIYEGRTPPPTTNMPGPQQPSALPGAVSAHDAQYLPR